MRIGVDATCWWNRRGFGRYTRLLVGAMLASPRGHTFVLFVDREPAPEMLHDHVEIVRVRSEKTVTEAAVAEARRGVRDILKFRRAAMQQNMDVMYFPAVYSWFPTGPRAPTVVTFHDAIAERFTKLVFPDLRGRLLWGLKLWLARKTAKRITTVSNSAREEIVTHLGIPRDRISVVTEAADPLFAPVKDKAKRAATRARLGIEAKARLLLYVGGMAPHKNLLRLIDAFALASTAVSDLMLVFVGDPKGDGFLSHVHELEARIATHPELHGRVMFTGYLSDDDLATLYSDATAVAMPAFSEGFGLPAAEAIACGTPVIATRDGAVAEVVQAAGLFFDPLDTSDMARAIIAIADEATSQDVRRACLKRAAELSWSISGSRMLDVLESYGRGA